MSLTDLVYELEDMTATSLKDISAFNRNMRLDTAVDQFIQAYSLQDDEQTLLHEYVTELKTHLDQKRQGEPDVKAFLEPYLGRMTLAATLAGSVCGFLFSAVTTYVINYHELTTMIIASVGGGIVGSLAEQSYHVVSRLLGVPSLKTVPGTWEHYLVKREEILDRLDAIDAKAPAYETS